MIAQHETFDGTFPFKANVATSPGFRMHYVDEGPRDARETLLLLHGEPTWGYLFRNVIPRLSNRHRVIVPDHMGFGKSATPQDRSYTATAHVDNLEALVLELDMRNITLVLHDWGGPIGTGFALRHPERVARLIVTNSVVPLGLPVEAELLPKNTEQSRWFRWASSAYKNGTLEEVLGNLGVTILAVMKGLQGFERTENVDAAWLRAYGEPFVAREECVGAIAFPKSIVTGEDAAIPTPDEQSIAALRKRPAMMIEGMGDYALLPQFFIPIFEAAFPDAPIHCLEHAGHFLYEDEPETIALLIEQFVALTQP